MSNFRLEGKAAIVTGAAGGIGGAIVRAFRDAGASVAGVDLDAAKIRADLALACDVSSEGETRAAVERAASALGGLHVLVNTAATRDPTGTVTDLDLKEWNRVFAVNVGGARAARKPVRAARRARAARGLRRESRRDERARRGAE